MPRIYNTPLSCARSANVYRFLRLWLLLVRFLVAEKRILEETLAVRITSWLWHLESARQKFPYFRQFAG